MSVNLNYRERILIYSLLLLFMLIAYLPLASLLFALKNDALTTNFPNKYFFSASLHSGHLPLWNPYVNFGLPLYADPGFAFWNPLTWVFGYFGYSIAMLSVEILFFIWLAGIASFELGSWLGHSKTVAFCMGAMYMCSGFFIGNLQHTNFLTAAAFLPLVVKTYLDLHQSFTVRKFFFCMVSIYMLASGGHPAIPIACLYFLLLLQAGLIIFNNPDPQRKEVFFRLLRTDLLLVAGFLVLAAPLLFSYYEIFPHFVRSAPVNQAILPDTGFDFSSYISFIFPFSVTGKNDIFSNDPLMRNGYFSLAGLLCFLIALKKNKNSYQKIFLIAGIGMLVLSLGGPIKASLYSVLPLLSRIRTNGEIRVFSILSFILVGAYILDDLLKGLFQRIFNRLLISITAISFLFISLRLLLASLNTVFISKSDYGSGNAFTAIRDWLYGLTFLDRIFINAGILVVLIGIYFLLKRKLRASVVLPLFIMLDLVSFSWTQLPVTGVQMKSACALQKYFAEVPSGIPIPKLLPLQQNQYFGEDIQNLFGCWSYYSKQPGTPFLCSYPSGLNQTVLYFNSRLPDSLNRGPFLFTRQGAGGDKLKINSFSPTEMNIEVRTGQGDSLILLQNHYIHWEATVNGKAVPIVGADIAFMSVPLEPGVNIVRFIFRNQPLRYITSLSIMAWIVFFLFAFKSGRPIKPEDAYFIRNIFP